VFCYWLRAGLAASIKDYQLLSLVGRCEAQPNVVSSSSFPCSVVFCWVPSKSAVGAFSDVMQAKQTPYLSYLQDTLQLVSLSVAIIVTNQVL
jgi:hypothetical protein